MGKKIGKLDPFSQLPAKNFELILNIQIQKIVNVLNSIHFKHELKIATKFDQILQHRQKTKQF